jgi:hypothetical protein
MAITDLDPNSLALIAACYLTMTNNGSTKLSTYVPIYVFPRV